MVKEKTRHTDKCKKPVVGFADDKVQVDTLQSQQEEADELNGKHTTQE
jgi:hypothetical protein